MEKLIEKSNRMIRSVQYPHRRDVTGNINWEWRMNGIVGSRGTGKTTLLLQKLAEYQKAGQEALYVRLDDLYFADHTVYDLADAYRKNGGKYLYLDEVHKYPGWARELKNIYDSIPGLILVFSGSSIIELTRQDADLSRRALIYEMTGLSFREYLVLSGIISLPAFPLDELLNDHTRRAADISQQIPVLKHFSSYLRSGFYPFFLEPARDYLLTLEQTIRTVIETDLRFLEGFDVSQSKKMLTLLKVIASSAPFKPNIVKISEKTGLHRQTVLQYLHYLEKARLIRMVNYPDKYISRLQKPDKIYLDNPNLFFALNPYDVNTGNLRETFALNQLLVNQEVCLHDKGDFLVDGRFVFEVGGRNKTGRQVSTLQQAYIFADDMEIGHHNRIPLWLLGFLY
ncbi:MAG: ATP-binding protein [Bacteroidales bacterium]|nr:ATP-binding protein [Bacteroidales bacterium]